jgi:lactate dehydrogenase-like 2-hydroxyacid dehydrogenase
MIYQHVVFKDKADMTPGVMAHFPGATLVGAREKFEGGETTVLSTKFSRVGKGTLDRCPELQAIVVRAHGVDMVDVDECQKRGIQVFSTAPTAASCAQWLRSKTPTEPGNIVLLGRGPIGRAYLGLQSCTAVITSKTPKEEVEVILRSADTLIFTLPLTEATRDYTFKYPVVDRRERPVTVISISRGELFGNARLRSAVQGGTLVQGHFDILDPSGREDLLASCPNLHYYGHVAWKHAPLEELSYAEDLKRVIDSASRVQSTGPRGPQLGDIL